MLWYLGPTTIFDDAKNHCENFFWHVLFFRTFLPEAINDMYCAEQFNHSRKLSVLYLVRGFINLKEEFLKNGKINCIVILEIAFERFSNDLPILLKTFDFIQYLANCF